MVRFSLTFAALLLATAAAAQTHDHTTAATTQTAGHDHAMMAMNHDAMFADAMTMHHRDGVKMARLAVDKSANAAIRSMAQAMIDDQTREIDQMQSARGDAPKMSMPAMHDMPGMMSEAEMQRDMARLESATGREFDLAFTELMAKHHDGAIRMAQHELEKGTNAAMREIARGIAGKQTRERQQLLAMNEQLSNADEPMTSAAPVRQRMSKD